MTEDGLSEEQELADALVCRELDSEEAGIFEQLAQVALAKDLKSSSSEMLTREALQDYFRDVAELEPIVRHYQHAQRLVHTFPTLSSVSAFICVELLLKRCLVAPYVYTCIEEEGVVEFVVRIVAQTHGVTHFFIVIL